jgi:hypothetical protein
MDVQQIMEMVKAMQEKADANNESDRKQTDANLKDLREDIKSSQAEMRAILDAWITDIKDTRKKTTACQDVTGPNPEKMEPNLGEKEAVMEQQEISKEEITVHSPRAC